MSEYTPGPYEAKHFDDSIELWNWDARPEFPIAVIPRDGDYEGNVQLLKAAPDLLQACREALEHEEHLPGHMQIAFGAMLRAAIAKATGETEEKR